MMTFMVAIALLSALALALGYAVLRLANQQLKPLLIIALSGVYFVGVFSLFAGYVNVCV